MPVAGAEQCLPSLPVRDADRDDGDGIEGSIDQSLLVVAVHYVKWETLVYVQLGDVSVCFSFLL